MLKVEKNIPLCSWVKYQKIQMVFEILDWIFPPIFDRKLYQKV